MSASQRRKGHRFEREIANMLKELFPNARRGLQYQDGSQCSDVVGTPFHIECKVGKKPVVRRALEQAANDSDGSKWTLCVIKDDRSDPFIAMPLSDWFELVQEWKEREK